jgi:hypothetical protein
MSIIKIKSGYSNFTGGRTSVELYTIGKIKIENEYKGEKQQMIILINVDENLYKMISNLVSVLKNWEYNNRKGVPDEARYEVEIFDIGSKDAVIKFSIWHNDLKSVPVIGEMINYMKNLVKQVTEQKVIL